MDFRRGWWSLKHNTKGTKEAQRAQRDDTGWGIRGICINTVNRTVCIYENCAVVGVEV